MTDQKVEEECKGCPQCGACAHWHAGVRFLPHGEVEAHRTAAPRHMLTRQATRGSIMPYPSGQIKLFHPELVRHQRLSEMSVGTINVFRVPHLKDWVENLPKRKNLFERTKITARPGEEAEMTEELAQLYATTTLDNDVDQAIMVDVSRKPSNRKGVAFVRAGARQFKYWKANEVKAAVVTCGGLCPGLNDVVEEVVNTMFYRYGVNTIYGIRAGFRGFYEAKYLPYLKLTPQSVLGIQNSGGTVLGSSRGGFDLEKIMKAITTNGINQIIVIGGDGSHRAASNLATACIERKLKVCVCAVPKTIDNDVGVIDRSFGFNTAVDEARKAIMSARTEAVCAPNGIGIVKLMGRHAGFIAAYSTLASRNVDLCLIPEVPFAVAGVMQHVQQVIEKQGNAVVVVAEGAGADILTPEQKTDESGNLVLAEIGLFLRKKLKKHFAEEGVDINIKYHDPSYMIRSVPANASDSVYCMVLAQAAVHGIMAGYTAFSSGLVNNRTVYIPLEVISICSPTRLNPFGRTWERVVTCTHQPKFHPDLLRHEQQPALETISESEELNGNAAA